MRKFIESLEGLGFGTDRDINGADCVDTINEHFPALKKKAEAVEEVVKLSDMVLKYLHPWYDSTLWCRFVESINKLKG